MLEFIITGGWALWIITGCSVLALGITFERWRPVPDGRQNSESLLAQLFALIEQGKVKDALELCGRTPGPVAETVGIGLRKLVFLERIGKKPRRSRRASSRPWRITAATSSITSSATSPRWRPSPAWRRSWA